MDFQTAVRTVLLEKYATFSGRARRSELWWFALFNLVVSLVLSFVDGILFGWAGASILSGLFSLAVLIPSIAVGARRLHDIGRSGWWQLVAFIPIIGLLLLLYWYIQPSQDGSNEFGPNPITGA